MTAMEKSNRMKNYVEQRRRRFTYFVCRTAFKSDTFFSSAAVVPCTAADREVTRARFQDVFCCSSPIKSAVCCCRSAIVGTAVDRFCRRMVRWPNGRRPRGGRGAEDAAAEDNAPAEDDAAKTETEEAPDESVDQGADPDSPGMDDLDNAFELKINSKSTRDLDKVAQLCEQAIEKGLEADAAEQAKILAKTAYYEHAQQLSARIFAISGKPDPRWKALRREALRRLKKAVKLDEEMASAYVMMARLHTLPSGDRKAGKEAIEKALSMIQGDDELMSDALIAKVRLSDDILDESVMSDVDEAIRLNPENRQARGLRSQLLLRAGKLEEALEDLDVVLESANSFDAYASQIDRLMKDPEFKNSKIMQEAALKYLDKAMELKADPKLHMTKAIVLQTMGQPEAALAEVDKNIELVPGNYKTLVDRAKLNAQQDKIKDAVADLDKALELKPGEPSVLLLRMGFHVLDENNEQAIADCIQLNEISKNNYELEMQLAQLYLTDDQPTKGAEVATKTLEQYQDGVWDNRNPRDGYRLAMRRLRALRMRGDCYLNSGDHAKAIDDYELGLDLTEVIADFKSAIPRQEPPTLPDNLPEGLKEQALEQWEQLAQQLEKEYTGDSGVLNNLAWVLGTSPDDDLRDGERAIELATDAAEITEYKAPHILSTLAAGYAEAGDFEKAKEWIRKGIEVNQEDIEAAEAREDLDETQKKSLVKSYQEQGESLGKELASYEERKAWRERQTSKKEAELSKEDQSAEAEQNDGAEAPKTEMKNEDADDDSDSEDNDDDTDSEDNDEDEDPDKPESPENSEEEDDGSF